MLIKIKMFPRHCFSLVFLFCMKNYAVLYSRLGRHVVYILSEYIQSTKIDVHLIIFLEALSMNDGCKIKIMMDEYMNRL